MISCQALFLKELWVIEFCSIGLLPPNFSFNPTSSTSFSHPSPPKILTLFHHLSLSLIPAFFPILAVSNAFGLCLFSPATFSVVSLNPLLPKYQILLLMMFHLPCLALFAWHQLPLLHTQSHFQSPSELTVFRE